MESLDVIEHFMESLDVIERFMESLDVIERFMESLDVIERFYITLVFYNITYGVVFVQFHWLNQSRDIQNI
jgi:hypothetical protein